LAALTLTPSTCSSALPTLSFFAFSTATARTELYPLSLHDALPICCMRSAMRSAPATVWRLQASSTASSAGSRSGSGLQIPMRNRSEEHTSELQSHLNLVCRLLLEKKNDGQQDHRRDAGRVSRGEND